MTNAHVATSAWPTNLGAYAKAITGALPLIPAGLLTGTNLDAPTLAAFATASAGHVALLLTGRPALKKAASWAGTAAAAIILAAAQYEGAPGISLGTVAQWDYSDLATILALTLASFLHTTVPNAPAEYAPGAHVVEGDLPEPETAAAGDALEPRVAAESVTSLIPVVRTSPESALDSEETVTA